jgi:hypothetical protein
MNTVRIAALGCALTLALPVAARGQALPSEPFNVGNGRLVVSGHATASISSDDDDPGWFNYTDYENNTLRLVRLGMTAALKATDRVSVLGEIRTENWDGFQPYALYVRVRPWLNRSIDIQAGRIPPTFGAFARRSYETDNPLIGYPLAYQYLTTIRTDALPGSAEELVSQRGRGWLVTYSTGSTVADEGVPLSSAFRWDTGVQLRAGSGPVEASFAVTAGSLGAPRVKDDNDSRQIAVRLAFRPSPAWILGISGARAAYLSNDLGSVLPAGRTVGDFTQRAAGADVEYSAGYWLLRAETILSWWNVPSVGDLRALAWSGEARVKIRPGLFVAGRLDRLTFSHVIANGVGVTWDAPVTRVEAGAGYYLRRNVITKLVYQYNWRDSDQFRELGMVGGQIGYWF